jgi:hypothetical protein
MYKRILSSLEYEAVEYLHSIGQSAPGEYYIEPFERIYHRLFKIYPALHYLYLWHKHGREYASQTLERNMDKVYEEYSTWLESERVNHELMELEDTFNPFEEVKA